MARTHTSVRTGLVETVASWVRTHTSVRTGLVETVASWVRTACDARTVGDRRGLEVTDTPGWIYGWTGDPAKTRFLVLGSMAPAAGPASNAVLGVCLAVSLLAV
jgi:hypothetical protein